MQEERQEQGVKEQEPEGTCQSTEPHSIALSQNPNAMSFPCISLAQTILDSPHGRILTSGNIAALTKIKIC